MPDAADQPMKRRPGRPRKSPLPATDPVTPDSLAAEVVAGKVAKPTPKDPDDERIGQEADDPRYTSIVFPDGAQYRIEAGVIVERVS